MARDDWTALTTNPQSEYTAYTELIRFGLSPYLPQIRRRWLAPQSRQLLMRQYPLFPRYLLLPYRDLNPTAIRTARGLSRQNTILSDKEGRPWRTPDKVVQAIKTAEHNGKFDEILFKGDKIAFNSGILQGIQAFIEKSSLNTVELLSPLFGGARLTTAPDAISRVA
jgi:hypothetical protein